ALGTDSTLTGSATLLDEMREAQKTGLATTQEIFAMVTSVPAAIFGVQNRGRISEGCAADLVVLSAEGSSSGDVLCRAKPRDLALVLIGGRPRLARPELAEALGLGAPNVRLEDSPRWLCGRPGEQLRTIEQAIGVEALGQHPLGRILQAL
ncbi:MAG: amidohydrolase family protein, partial [Acidobacteriota bacterium]